MVQPHATPPDHRLERLSFFSDAVFAIAITLLIIEIHVPHVADGSDRAFLIALARLIPSFIGFTISFFVIGAFWHGHHRAFACAAHWDPRVVLPNTMLLFTIAAMPFFTAFSSSHAPSRVPVGAYCFWLILTGVFNMRLQRVLSRPPVVSEEVPAEHLAAIRRRGLAVVLGATTAFILAMIVPEVALASLATMPLWRRLLDRLAAGRQPA